MQRADPNHALVVDCDAPNTVPNEAILIGVIRERLAVIFRDPTFRPKPEITAQVFNNTSYGKTAKALIYREIFQSISIVSTYTVAVGAEPKVALFVLEYSADVIAYPRRIGLQRWISVVLRLSPWRH